LPQEQIFADFSGGMNASAAVDKLDPKECLLAENVRLDETGNVESAGAYTNQNTSSYVGSTFTQGTATIIPTNIHSLHWNPALGGVAGIGRDVFTGPTLGGMTSAIAGANFNEQKMSFASAIGKVYFDIGNAGYWTDMQNFLTVDWPPPTAVGSTVTTGTPGAVTQVSTGTNTVIWSTTTGLVGVNPNAPAQILLSTGQTSEILKATMSTSSFAISTVGVAGIQLNFMAWFNSTPNVNRQWLTVTLLNNNVPVGNPKTISFLSQSGFNFAAFTLGGTTDLWGLSSWTQAQINSGNFGFQVVANSPISPPYNPSVGVGIYNSYFTIFQNPAGSGMVSGTATGTLTGTYQWAATFVSSSGEESDVSGNTALLALSGQGGTLTSVPTGDARTASRNIYRIGGALTSRYLVGSIPDNLTTTYYDNEADIAALAEGVIVAGDVPGDYPNTRFNLSPGNAVGRFPCLHYDRMFWVVPGTNKFYWSKPLNGFAYPSVNFIQVGDNKPITRLISIFGELIIFKTDSIWRLTGTDESSFNLTQTPSSVGTDMSFTIVALPDKIIFANRYGIWIFNGYTSQPLSNKLDLWFKQQNRTGKSVYGFSGFNPPEAASPTVPLLFEAVGNSEKYYFAYSETGQTVNNSAVLVFDVKRGNITKRSPYINIGGAFPVEVAYIPSMTIDSVTGLIYIGDYQGFVSLYDDWSGATIGENGAANFDFQTGYIDLQRGSNKSLWALEFFINTNGQSIIPYVYYDGGENFEQLPAISTANLQRVVRPVQATNARKMQNFSVRINGSLNPVNIGGTPQIRLVHIKALYDVRVGRSRTGQ
jgi:hypothetical protein